MWKCKECGGTDFKLGITGYVDAYFDKYNYRSFYDIDLMQYTGLKDMRGKEIYEGDILFESFSEEYFKVVFENGSFRAEDDKDSLDLEDYAHICEVVGNIYENPELLGG